MEIRTFMKVLHANNGILTRQQIKTLKGQALSGNIAGAYQGIATLIQRQQNSTRG